MEHYEFVAQQKEDNKMATYYVTQEQLDFLNTIYEELHSLDELLKSHTEAKNLFNDYSIPKSNAVLRYLGGDKTIEFKVKRPLYRLWRIDDDGKKVYMWFNGSTPDWSINEKSAFTATLAEIRNWQTPAWDIEEVK